MNEMDLNQYDTLNIHTIAVPVKGVGPDAGPAKILNGLSSHSLLPVIEDQTRKLLRVIRDQDFLRTGASNTSADTFEPHQGTLLLLDETARIEDAKTLFQTTGQSLIPIVGPDHTYTGYCASRRELMKLLQGHMIPPRIGGLATPLGVYMTSGVYSSGAGVKGLIATGVVFALMAQAVEWGYVVFYSFLAALLPGLFNGNEMLLLALQMGFMFFAIMALIRLTPMSGLHAAEHMTINAVENGLEITAKNVRTQPREHLRCGTNLMVLLVGVQLAWISMETMRPYLSPVGALLYIFFWILAITTSWRKIGLWLQTHFTTKPPTDAQLESGMKAGRELLVKYLEAPHPPPNFIQRLWGSGILQMITSFLATTWLINSLLEGLGHQAG